MTDPLTATTTAAARDHWAAQAQQAWQECAELRQQNADLTNSLQGMIGLITLLCARPDVTAELVKAAQENHRLVTARAVLERVGM